MATRKRSLLEYSIPEPAGMGQPQSSPPLGLLGTAENVSIGAGYGVRNQLAGLLGMIQNPGAVVNSLYDLARTPPNQLAQMAVTGVKDTARNALAGPLGFGEFVGNNISPRSLLPGVKTTREMTVYHGSPHNFDEFKLNKDTIGTGEGAQAYGHGLYFSESPDVAGQYAKNVKDMTSVKRINDELSAAAKVMSADEIPGSYRKYRTAAGVEAAKKYDELMASRQAVLSAPGKTYHADIPDESIAKMLDWDAPLSQQPEAVRKALTPEAMGLQVKQLDNGFMAYVDGANKPIGNFQKGGTPESFRSNWLKSLNSQTGQGAYRWLTTDQAKASELLNRAGVPGIRFLDGSSRAAGTGTRNVVLFDDKLVKILKKE